MNKIFDHRYAYRGWLEVADPVAAIKDIFDEERWCDRDQATTYVIEHWSSETDTITYHIANVTGWHYGEEPHMSVTYTDDAKEAASCHLYSWKPTSLDPRRDYILTRPLAYGKKWPPTEEANAKEEKSSL